MVCICFYVFISFSGDHVPIVLCGLLVNYVQLCTVQVNFKLNLCILVLCIHILFIFSCILHCKYLFDSNYLLHCSLSYFLLFPALITLISLAFEFFWMCFACLFISYLVVTALWDIFFCSYDSFMSVLNCQVRYLISQLLKFYILSCLICTYTYVLAMKVLCLFLSVREDILFWRYKR